jgi:hypothetical protein
MSYDSMSHRIGYAADPILSAHSAELKRRLFMADIRLHLEALSKTHN